MNTPYDEKIARYQNDPDTLARRSELRERVRTALAFLLLKREEWLASHRN